MNDGNCGFRAFAYLNNQHENDYYEVKIDMLAAIHELKSPYVDEDGRKTDYYNKFRLIDSLSQPKGPVLNEHWLDTSGLQPASGTFRRVVIYIEPEVSNKIYFPLCFSVSESHTKPFIINLFHRHFKAVFCASEHPTFREGNVPVLNNLLRLIAEQNPRLLEHFDSQ